MQAANVLFQPRDHHQNAYYSFCVTTRLQGLLILVMGSMTENTVTFLRSIFGNWFHFPGI